jgi:hypothetical protein
MKAARPLPPHSELKQYFEYHITSGKLYRVCYDKHRGVLASHSFRELTPNTPYGYCVVRYKGVLYKAHRIIWCLVTGDDPGAFEIDHIDRDPSNNSWLNLRLASSAQQALNRKVRSDSTSSLRGVLKTGSKYQAKIQRNGVRVHLGTFETKEQAARAYLAALDTTRI